jgi:hypothetical protein
MAAKKIKTNRFDYPLAAEEEMSLNNSPWDCS